MPGIPAWSIRRGLNQGAMEQAHRAQLAGVTKDGKAFAAQAEKNRKALPGILAEAEKLVGRRVYAGGRVGRAARVDRKTGALIVAFMGGKEEKFNYLNVTPA